MKVKFNNKQKSSLLSKGLNRHEIKAIEETLYLYNSKDSLVKIPITIEDILKLKYIRNYINVTPRYGVQEPRILKKFVEEKIDLDNNENIKFKGIFYSKPVVKDEIASDNPNDAIYYKIYFKDNDFKVYYFDYVFRVIKIKTFTFNEVLGCSLVDVKASDKKSTIKTLILKIDESKAIEYELRSLDSYTMNQVRYIYEYLLKKEVPELNRKLTPMQKIRHFKNMSNYLLGGAFILGSIGASILTKRI
ncbi:MAG: hypothetical protein ACRCYC_10295 [Paraclostridium sp.]|uniref:hypothetical protein n=1 Tax=Paraclostridium sp. TaxID=2023273 RepID=UPI003F32E716